MVPRNVLIGVISLLCAGSGLFAPAYADESLPLRIPGIDYAPPAAYVYAPGKPIADGDPVVRIPFHYTRTFRLKTPLKGRLMGQTYAPAGTPGFRLAGITEQDAPNNGAVYCVFRPDKPQDYVQPFCFMLRLQAFGNVPFASVLAPDSNIPLNAAAPNETVLHIPEFEYGPVDLEHPFFLDLVVRKRKAAALEIEWRSDGRTVKKESWPVDASGTVRLSLPGATLLISAARNTPKASEINLEPPA